MLTDNPGPGNGAALEGLRELRDQLVTVGKGRNDIFAALLRANAEAGSPVAAEELIKLLQTPDGDEGVQQGAGPLLDGNGMRHPPPSVNQRARNPGEPGRTTKPNESERESPRRGTAQNGPEPQPRKTAAAVFRAELDAGVPSSLPFAEYLARAIDEWRRVLGEGLLPAWQAEVSPLFHFCRLVKAHPDMEAVTARQALKRVEQVLRGWRGGIPEGRKGMGDWEAWFGVAREDAQVEILDAWDKVRYLPGQTPLDNALRSARECPLVLRDEETARRADGYPLFVSVAGWLQVAMGDRAIMLPVELLAKALGVKPMTVSRYRRWAVEDGYLHEVRPYEFRGKGKGGKATEFRFAVPLFPILRERAGDT
jgi:hypothetical protein